MGRCHHFTVSDFHCTLCGAKGMPIPRKMSKQREARHLKKLYCIHCQKETNHVEIRCFDYDIEDLLKDIENGVYANDIEK